MFMPICGGSAGRLSAGHTVNGVDLKCFSWTRLPSVALGPALRGEHGGPEAHTPGSFHHRIAQPSSCGTTS